MVRLFQSDGSSSVMKLVNLGFRVLQFLIAVPIVAIYASQMKQGYSGKGYNYNELIGVNNLQLGVAAGAIGIVSAAIFIGMLLVLEYKWVCRVCPWDLIVTIIFAALFAQMKKKVHPGDQLLYEALTRRAGIDGDRIHLMWNTVWIDLVSMLLWLITFLMGVVSLVFSKVRGSKPTW